MGCISSKILARSISVHEERKQGSRRMANGIPLLEDLLISANGNDQYLALVRAANTVSNKLNSRSFRSNTFPEPATEPVASESIKKSEISPRLSQEGGKQIERDKSNRSKSCHSFPERIVSSIAQGNLSDSEGQHNLSSKDVTGSRSFHTLEEYDNLVNKIWLPDSPRVLQNEFIDEEADSRTIEELKVSALVNIIQSIEDNDSAAKKMLPPCSHNENSSEDSKLVEEISIKSMTLERATTPNPNEVENEVNQNEKTYVPKIAAQGVNTSEKVNKRKAIAKRLESLRIPSTVELPAIASLREWLPGSGIYSSASYVTPKFGSFSSQIDTRNENESSEEDSVFSPELVSAFEKSMQKLEAEEETILKQIIENVEEESEFSPKE